MAAPPAVHGVAGGATLLGVATWPVDLLVRFGYDLPEHEHPWDGEWMDDAFEAAARRLRTTGAKLLRALDEVGAPADAVDRAPLRLDLVVAYLGHVGRDLAVVAPCCYGVEGRPLAGARAGGLTAVAAALRPLDPLAASALRPPPEVQRLLDGELAAHHPELYAILDAEGRATALPRARARLLEASGAATAAAVDELATALGAWCRWLDGAVDALQRAVAARAEDGDVLLERWATPDWAVVGARTPAAARLLPAIG